MVINSFSTTTLGKLYEHSTKLQPFALLVQTECNLDSGMLAAPGHLRILKIASGLTEATPLYENCMKTLQQGDGFQVFILEQALGAFPSGWEPAA